MKILAQEEEQDYYAHVRNSGVAAGVGGFLLGIAATAALRRYYAPFRHLSPAVRSTIVIYPTIFAISYGTNHGSHAFESRVHPETKQYFKERQDLFERSHIGESRKELSREWLYEHKIPVLGTTWALSMLGSLRLFGRDPLETGVRKLVQARVLAQATTLSALLLLALIEADDMKQGNGKYQKVIVVDTSDPAHRQRLDEQLGLELHPTPVTLKGR
ncbi:uncharacterized protein Z519_07428 [Cladophialophora bantiana CBS 173.52]|uniref:HIG1 domain-containing protein n=1 Tax=Cladophialophora bantiana (strain ATCC 10958 / CBS 173.52 / CDC B-1940 / NIH 8579) TaxID=1442370 RepID=A0A0D2HGQ3_CLAB1|nr:uncharacterized protein Z519_07428 [Cladophialophora bantiana CBS 173.52]KIW92443.1 hypothetical protein Z519_07428 [Cladophialophora bantiana CBS 173.52]